MRGGYACKQPTATQPSVGFQAGDFLKNGLYIVDGELNRGGTAMIYKGRDAEGREVALKFVRVDKGDAMPGISASSVQREVEYAKILKHENIAQCLDAFEEPERDGFVIVSELVNGDDILEMLNQQGHPFHEKEARLIFFQIVRAVSFLHKKGFCHRDLKPENVVVSNGIAKIVDFGLCKRFLSARTLKIGTPDYMPPEMLEGTSVHRESDRPYDPEKLDIWSMGVVLYIMLTRKYPFASRLNPNNISLTLSNIKECKYNYLPSHLSQPAKDLIQSMLKKSPNERASLDAIMKHQWATADLQHLQGWRERKELRLRIPHMDDADSP